MKAILIDPYTETISEYDVGEGKLEDIYKALDCDAIEAVYINADHVIFVDEYGLSRKDRFFKLDHFQQPLAGKGIVLGLTEDEGEGRDNCDCSIPLEAITAAISFPKIKYRESMPIPPGSTVNHPVLGPNVPIIGEIPIFTHRDDDNGT